MQRLPNRFQQSTIWNALTGLAILVIGVLLVGFIWLVSKVFGFLQPVLLPLAVAAIVAYLLDPIVRFFQKRGLSRQWSVISVFVLFVAFIAGIVSIMIPLVDHQVDEFSNRNRPEHHETAKPETAVVPGAVAQLGKAKEEAKPMDEMLVDQILILRKKYQWSQAFIDPMLNPPASDDPSAPPRASITTALDEQLPENERPRIILQNTALWIVMKSWFAKILPWIKGGAGEILGFLGLALGFVMVPIYLFYFLKESASIKIHWHEYVPLKASAFKTELVDTLTEINGYLISFFRGQVVVAFIDGILVGIALTIYGLPLGLLIGIIMAMLGIIPYIGNIITLIPSCVLAYFHFSVADHRVLFGFQDFLGSNPWAYVGGVVAIFIIVQQINSIVTAPKIVGDSVGLHPMTVIFSMLFWSLVLGGFVGALLAVPMTAAVKVLFRRFIWDRNMRDTSASSPFDSEEWQPGEENL
jgi:predicted PurR-regulated permease PerM